MLNGRNEEWVRSNRHLSPQVLCEFLEIIGQATQRYLASLDSLELSNPVNWCGPESEPVRLYVDREYTERWVHQQQIRDALKNPD